jgi:hypothetical protein
MATRFKGPLLNSDVTGLGARAWFKNLPQGNEPDYVAWMKDWLDGSELVAADWVNTVIDGGTDTDEVFAVASDALNGELTITTNNADNDANSIQSANEAWQLRVGKKLWYEARWKIEDADDSDVLMGLSITDTTPLDASDRINFKLTEGSAALAVECAKNSTATTVAAIATLADDTYVTTGLYWNGSNAVEVYVNRAKVATLSSNIPDDEQLALNIRVQTGAAATRTLTIDYIKIVQER